jgi:hypothetical protein
MGKTHPMVEYFLQPLHSLPSWLVLLIYLHTCVKRKLWILKQKLITSTANKL